jgi:ketosteroid isomerase-like protein
MPFTGPLEERIAIRELYDAYADGACRMDRAAWLAPWADDAVWKTHYFELKGIKAIGEKYDELMAPVTATSFFTQICAIEVAGVTAKARAIAQERLAMPGGSYRLTGRYEDSLVKLNGIWRYKHREYHVMFEELPGVGE